MSHRDQRACLPSQCILSDDTFPGHAPRQILGPPSQRFTSKARAPSIRATKRKSKDRDRVKPPANGFLLFRSEFVSNPANQVSEDGSRKRQVDLTKEAGATWRRLSQAQRDIYRVTARQNMEDHKTTHPDYWSSRRGKDGRYTRADGEPEQGSAVKAASQDEHEAVLTVDPFLESGFAPAAAHSPSSSAPSPCPSLTSSISDDDCPTPQARSQQSFVERPPFDGLEPYCFSDFIDESHLLPIDPPSVPSWWLLGDLLSTHLAADSAASKEFSEPEYVVSYEDWAFVQGEEFFDNSSRGVGAPLADFVTSHIAPLDA
ncbi:hypothetical protein LXA43DRAFT_1100455 [Ganoderma leucocontextum]|nr:hypothetical protein LXA43DRAFT_1100455 [Ganoderma leucocontextum]